MGWLLSIDTAAFRWVNHALANPVFDRVVPWFSGNALFGPALVALLVWLVCCGGWRGRWFVALLLATLVFTDSWVVNGLKETVRRERPFSALADARLLLGRGGEFASFPSAHAANTMAALVLAAAFFPRSLRWMACLVGLVGFSRVYCGAHYPGDVLAGWLIGATCAGSVLAAVRVAWERGARRWFPVWWARHPALLGPDPVAPIEPAPDNHWLRAGWLLAATLLVGRLLYIRAAVIQLSEDEAYQWLWSKHLDWCYFSKPPGIAVAQWIGTHLAGDTELGVRLLAPVFAFVLALVMLPFVARQTNGRTAFFFLLAVTATPLLAVGSVLITVDPILVLFATLGLVAGWNAIRRDSTGWWLVTGLCWAGTMQAKFGAPFLWAGTALCFAADPAARAQARRPGPWLAFALSLIALLPVLLWNQAHDWPNLHHLEDRGGLKEPWTFRPGFITDFALVVPLLLNPAFSVAILHAAVRIWRPVTPPPSGIGGDASPNLLRYLFWMGGAVFFFYAAYTLRARVQPNWIAAGVVPWMLMAVIYWGREASRGSRVGIRYLKWGVAPGLPLMVLLHEPNLAAKLAHHPLPARYDPSKRVRAFDELARVVEEQREKLAAETGRPVFIIADHYGRAGLLSFYLPQAKAAVGGPNPLVTVRSSDAPENQFWFWPEYRYAARRGQDAVYVLGTDHEEAPPARLSREFAEVRSLGVFPIRRHGEVFHQVQLFACRGLR